MKYREYFSLVAIIFLLFTNSLFCMQSFSPHQTSSMFKLVILQDDDYSSLRTMPGYVRPIFAHVPRNGRIEWYHVLCVDAQAPDQEIRDASSALFTQLSYVSGPRVEELILVKKAEMEGLKKLPFQVCNIKDGIPYGISEVDLDDIVSPQERDTLAGMKNLTAEWKRFYLLKFGVLSLLFFGPELYKYFEKSDKYNEIKDNELFQTIIEMGSQIKEKSDSFLGKGVLFAVFGAYPLWKFWKLNKVANVLNNYRYNTINFRDGIRVICKWTWYVGDPVGYMWDKDVRTAFMPIRKAKVMQVLTWFSSIGLLGCLLA